MEIRSIDNTVSLIERKINEVVNTGDISSEDMHCLKEAAETVYYLEVVKAMKEGSPANYDSYKRSNSMLTSENDSYRRSRSMDTGRYVSREGMPSQGYYDQGYSGHSIKDRMIDNLEHMVDKATSPYERETILSTIRDIEARP